MKRDSGLGIYLKAFRPEFLPASLLPLFLGTALAAADTGNWRSRLFAWSLVVTLLVHAGANALE